MKLLPPTKMKSSGRLFSCFHFFGGQGTLHAGLGEIIYGIVRQHGQHAADILVVHHAHDDVQAAVSLLFELLHNVADAAHVVSCIADQGGSILKLLPASHESRQTGDVRKAAPYAGAVNAVTGFLQQGQGGEDGLFVLLLVESFQFEFDARVVFAVIVLGKVDRGVHLGCLGQEDRLRLRSRFADDYGRTFLDDACLLARYLCQRVTQELHVVEADVGDDAQIRPDDVGAIQPSAQTYLDDGHVHLLVGKIAESHGGGQFEERRVERFEESSFLLHKVHDVFL